MNSITDVWNSVLELLAQDLTPVAMETWFKDCSAVELRDSSIVLCTPTAFRKQIIEDRFADSIKKALHDLFACDFEVSVVTKDELEAEKSRPQADLGTQDLSNFTFERFVVGSSNKFAHAAALAVAEGKAREYSNPLFIYGESGLGKTHLLYAIYNEVKRRHPEYNIVYVKGEKFTNDLILAIQTGRNIEFREKYRYADLFLMDDIQFIAGKTSTQEEFFHTFNTLFEANKQIVLTSDRPPIEINLLSDRLVSRFSSGLLADINPPDYETRMAIIRNKASQLGLILPDEVMDYIARNFTANIRQIEGAVKKVMAYQELIDAPVTITVAKQALSDLFKGENEFIPTPDDIIEETGKFFSIPAEAIKGKRQTRNISLARQISMFLIKKLTNLTQVGIGDVFGGRDHSTVISAVRRIEDLIKTDPELAKTIKDIESNINSRK